MKLHHGWAFPEADEFMVAALDAAGTYQRSHLDQAVGFVTDFRYAVDGGAHVGTWTRPLAGLFERVVAFEPSLDTFEALAANMAAFGCENTDLHHAALGTARGSVSMALDEKNTARKNTGARYVQPGGPVPMMTLDELELPSLGFLKLDVEGSEPAALLGGRKTLARCRPIVLFENKGLCRRFGFKPDAAQKVLTDVGYRQLAIAGCDLIWGPS